MLVTARLDNDKSDALFVDYLNALYAEKPPDLIVALGAPAANFVQRYRPRIFSRTPMLFTAVEARRVQYDRLTENDTVAAVAHDFPLAIGTILQVLPDTKVIAVVNGASPNEVVWQGELERELAPLSGRVELRWYNRLSFEDILKDAAGLPPRSAIFWHLMSVDAVGAVHETNTALNRLSAAANAPIFSYLDVLFGGAIVGGSMHSVQEGSAVAAAAAIRILNGEKAGDVKVAPTRFKPPRFDWRQLQRWGISESRLPPGSEVHFREPSAWQKYRMEISAVAAAMLLQAGLIFWLFLEHRRRHTAELTARDAISELAQMNRIAGAGELSASIAHEINQPLAAISSNASAAMNWLKAKTPDLEEARAAMAQVVSQSHRASDIITNLRAMFKKDTQQKGPVDLNKVIRSVLDLVGVELRKYDIEVRTRLEDGLPTVIGSEVQLQQVVLNLVMNAKDALQSTSLHRELRIKSARTEKDLVEVSIEDSGTGISASELETIFRPMFTTKSHGMGMGLSICRSIVEAHSGRIWVASSSESGTAFRFSLPASGTTD